MTLDMRLRNPRRAHKWHVEVECRKCAMMPFGGAIVGCKEEQRIFDAWVAAREAVLAKRKEKRGKQA